MARKTLVLAEARDGELRNVSFEAIAAGKQIADGGEVVAVICGDQVKDLGETLVHYGAERVLTVEDENLKNYTSEAYKQALQQVIESENPDAMVFGHTSMGKDLAPRLAAKLSSGLISDVTELSADGGDVELTRPIYAGKAFEKKKITDGLLFMTIRPNNIAALEKDEGLSGDVSSFDVDIKDLRTIVKEIISKSTGDGVDLSEAKIVVSGGRGVKSEDGFKPLYELAEVL
ncbi:MAG TPA: electron transfer flavoprotein subunit alpha/FixB family protein, partial [Bacillales bacterium]|nr:electron transfer flavoprotein subunit alpha/FixB family protein [Bacillales bacterium]